MTTATRTRAYTYVEVLTAVAHALKRPNGGSDLAHPMINPWNEHPAPNQPVARLTLDAGAPGDVLAWARVMGEITCILVTDHGVPGASVLHLEGHLDGPLVEVVMLVGKVPARFRGRKEITVPELEKWAASVPAEVVSS